MSQSKQTVEKSQADQPQSGTKRSTTVSSSNKKPAAPRSQAKSATVKGQAKSSTASPSRSSSAASVSPAPMSQPTGVATDDNSNRSLLEETSFSHFNTNISDVSGVVVPSDTEPKKHIQAAITTEAVEEENLAHLKSAGKHKSKQSASADTVDNPGDTVVIADPVKELRTLQKKVLKSEKKVYKLKKKVYKAEKKTIKKRKLRALKDKLTKAFAKWQRRKKRLEEVQA